MNGTKKREHHQKGETKTLLICVFSIIF
jgi:hypothetical protein